VFTDPPIHRSTDPDMATTAIDPEVARIWAQASQWHDALSEKPPKPASQAIAARISEAGVESVLEVVEWVYRGPDSWWRDNNPSPASFLRPTHFANLAPKARAWARRKVAVPVPTTPYEPLTPEEQAIMDRAIADERAEASS
jgi:hypothetical protein